MTQEKINRLFELYEATHGWASCYDQRLQQEYDIAINDSILELLDIAEWHRVTGEEVSDTFNILAIGSDNDGRVTSLTEMNRANAYMRTSPNFQETDLYVWYRVLDFPNEVK